MDGSINNREEALKKLLTDDNLQMCEDFLMGLEAMTKRMGNILTNKNSQMCEEFITQAREITQEVRSQWCEQSVVNKESQKPKETMSKSSSVHSMPQNQEQGENQQHDKK